MLTLHDLEINKCAAIIEREMAFTTHFYIHDSLPRMDSDSIIFSDED